MPGGGEEPQVPAGDAEETSVPGEGVVGFVSVAERATVTPQPFALDTCPAATRSIRARTFNAATSSAVTATSTDVFPRDTSAAQPS